MKRSVFKWGTVISVGLWPATAWAESSDPQESEQEIIVTAERANRSLKDTASSVVVASGQDIDAMAGVHTVNQFLDRIANIVTTEPGNDLPAVRGVDGTGPGGGPIAFFSGGRPRFSYLVDGRTLSFNEATFSDTALWDIDQVEVYRGPQSTLLGRNSIAGVVAIKTADPTFSWQGAARAMVGNRDEVQLAGAVGGPVIANVLAFRLSGNWQKSQSFVDFTGYPGAENPGRYDSKNVRGKLLLSPAPNIRSLLTLSYQDAREPQSNWIKPPYHRYVATDGGRQQPVFRARTSTATLDTGIDLTEVISAQLLLSATDFRINRYAPANTGVAQIDGKDYLVQPLLRYGSAKDRVSGFIGGYFYRARQDEAIDLFGGGGYRDKTDTNAVFGEVTVKPVDALSIILGARYEEETRTRVGATGPLATNFHEKYSEFLPKATISLDLSSKVTIGVMAARGYNIGGAGITLSPPFLGYVYKPEYVWNYEAFARAGLGNNISLTGNVFYSRYKDMQLPFYLSPLSIEIRNAERATTSGGELGLAWRPAPKNEIFANVGLLKTKINRFSDNNSVGKKLQRAPGCSVSAGFNFSPDDAFEMGADFRYSCAYFSDTLNTTATRISPFAVVNARLAYDLGKARLFLSARNLLNSNKVILKYQGYGMDENNIPILSEYGVPLEPRKISVGAEFRF